MSYPLVFSNSNRVNAIEVKGGNVHLHLTLGGRTVSKVYDGLGGEVTQSDMAILLGVSGMENNDHLKLYQATLNVNNALTLAASRVIDLWGITIHGVEINETPVVQVSGHYRLDGYSKHVTLTPIIVESFEQLCRDVANQVVLVSVIDTAKRDDGTSPSMHTAALSKGSVEALSTEYETFQNPNPTLITITRVGVDKSLITPAGQKRGQVTVNFTREAADGRTLYYQKEVGSRFGSLLKFKDAVRKATELEKVVFDEVGENLLEVVYYQWGISI